MTKVLFGIFIVAAGFISAALLWNTRFLKSGSPENFDVKSEHPTGVLGKFVFCMFTGPYMIADNGLAIWKRGELRFSVFLLCLLLAVLWSFCSGIFVVQMLVLTGIISV